MNKSKIVIFVYDITNKESFEQIKDYWYPTTVEILGTENVIYGIAANKCDLYENEKVKYEEAESFANEINAVIKETTATNHKQIDELVTELIKLFLNIKERTSCVPYIYPCDYYLDENFQDIILEETRLYKLPDDTIIDIPRRCRLLASEMLFNPKVVDKEDLGLRDLIVNSVRKSEIVNDSLKETLVNNIILSGGTTMIHGFSERIKKELSGYKDENEWSLEFKPIVVADNNRYISKWIGMSMIASMSAFDKLFIKKTEYQELGEERFSEVAQIF